VSVTTSDAERPLSIRSAPAAGGGETLVYRPSLVWRIGTGLTGAILLAAAIAGLFYFAVSRSGLSPVVGIVCCCLLLGLSIYALLSVFGIRLVIGDDGIDYRTAIVSRHLARADIKGYRILHNGVASYGSDYVPGLFSSARLALVPVDGAGATIPVARVFRWDARFKDWLATLTNLDAVERRQSETGILGNPRYGATQEDRAGALARARTTGYILSALAIPPTVCGYIFYNPPAILILLLAMLPWVALAADAMGQGMFTAVPSRNDAHPSLFMALLFPGVVLAFRALADYHLLVWEVPIGAGLVAGAAFTLLLGLADRGLLNHPGKFVLAAIFAVIYGFGVVAEANAQFNPTPAATYRVAVLAKHQTSGRHATWNLRLAGWGPRPNGEEVSVPPALYGSVRPGDTVCVGLHAGALAIPWFLVTRCS
jgi:hypothetical protein